MFAVGLSATALNQLTAVETGESGVRLGLYPGTVAMFHEDSSAIKKKSSMMRKNFAIDFWVKTMAKTRILVNVF